MIPFTKMHGVGNDFVLIDGFVAGSMLHDRSSLAIAMCDRKFGIGADGMIIVDKGESDPVRMQMFNADGSTSEMCGNGIRCVALFALRSRHVSTNEFRCETQIGSLELKVQDHNNVRVNMGSAHFDRTSVGYTRDAETWIEADLDFPGGTIKGSAISTGNPHFVAFVGDISSIPLDIWGPQIERSDEFPNRVNVHFVQITDRQTVVQRTWERGSGPTLACGTGACATVAVGHKLGILDREVEVRLPGGSLWVEIDEAGHLWMTGPAEFVFEGVWTPKLPFS